MGLMAAGALFAAINRPEPSLITQAQIRADAPATAYDNRTVHFTARYSSPHSSPFTEDDTFQFGHGGYVRRLALHIDGRLVTWSSDMRKGVYLHGRFQAAPRDGNAFDVSNVFMLPLRADPYMRDVLHSGTWKGNTFTLTDKTRHPMVVILVGARGVPIRITFYRHGTLQSQLVRHSWAVVPNHAASWYGGTGS